MKFFGYKIQDFFPLIVIFSLIALITISSQIIYGWNLYFAMRIMMASFFLIFGFFKIINLKGFAHAYAEYDLIAKKFLVYGYIYPFFELALGFLYLLDWNPFLTNFFTLILMLVSAAGVLNELLKNKKIVCACLGDVFNIPLTYVSLVEDIAMALMALFMIFKYI